MDVRGHNLTRLVVTLLAVAVFRLGQNVPIPGVDVGAIQAATTAPKYGVVDLLTGGALLDLSVFALGVLPALVANGRAAIAVAALMSAGVVGVSLSHHVLRDHKPLTLITLAACMTAGAAVTLRLADLITKSGLGDGTYVLLFAQVAAVFPGQLWDVRQSEGPVAFAVLILIGLTALVALLTIDRAERRVPLQYRRGTTGMRRTGGASTYIPIRVDQSGLAPILYALLLLYTPVLLSRLTPLPDLDESDLWYLVALPALVVFFAYARAALALDPTEVATNLQKTGGFVPGIRPGRPTTEYLGYIRTRVGAFTPLLLGAIALAPTAALAAIGNRALALTGTSVLIVLCLGIPTAKHVGSELIQRHYLSKLTH